MIFVGITAPAMFLRRIVRRQKLLKGFIAITSTCQWSPRLDDPMYTGVKAGLGRLADSISLDPQVEKTMDAAPSGMKTKYWRGTDIDTSEMMDPQWVADQILAAFQENFSYRFLKILGSPEPHIEIAETRPSHVIHGYLYAAPLCGFSREMPIHWPQGHFFTRIEDIEHITCPCCNSFATIQRGYQIFVWDAGLARDAKERKIAR